MEQLVIEMDITLLPYWNTEPYEYEVSLEIMNGAAEYCDALWIDGEPVDLSKEDYDLHHYLSSDKPEHHYKYLLKPNINYIPEGAFSNNISHRNWYYKNGTIGSISLPVGIKVLKSECFYGRRFSGDLILPDSIERINAESLDSCKIDGRFYLPDTVKYLGSLPEAFETKKEIILPEGMRSYTPRYIITDHLHIPSTMRECRARCSMYRCGNRDLLPSITIAGGNPYIGLENGKIVDLQEDKRNKLRKLARIKDSVDLNNVLGKAGLSFRFAGDSQTIVIPIHSCHSILFAKNEWGNRPGIERIIKIAHTFRALFEEYDSIVQLIDFDPFIDYAMNHPGVMDRKASTTMTVCQKLGERDFFTIDLSVRGYPEKEAAARFFCKMKEMLDKLHNQFGPFIVYFR